MRPATRKGLFAQMAAVLATGNRGTVAGMALPAALPATVARAFADDSDEAYAAALVEGDSASVISLACAVAEMPGPIVPVHASAVDAPLAYPLDRLVEEVSISINTAAAGGNASLMAIG